MSFPSLNRHRLAVIVVIAIGGWLIPMSVWSANQKPAEKPPELSAEVLAFIKPIEAADGDSELQKKLKERHNAAVSHLEERVAEYKSGARDLGVVLEAARLVTEAKLSLAGSAEAKKTALEQTLAVARLIESLMQQQLDKGFGSKADLARARHARLSVEVELLKNKQ